eukprot:TRINITY_DN6058_c0_g2_i1.p1 TRINITY_DN6058_c0_g2~~TRINITY_DN6058_c0_g2_i1.p1  ORF type:complete len:373 (-),score=63.20 TRINITY_DN6058_c0_g2_i1:94-1212(-)
MSSNESVLSLSEEKLTSLEKIALPVDKMHNRRHYVTVSRSRTFSKTELASKMSEAFSGEIKFLKIAFDRDDLTWLLVVFPKSVYKIAPRQDFLAPFILADPYDLFAVASYLDELDPEPLVVGTLGKNYRKFRIRRERSERGRSRRRSGRRTAAQKTPSPRKIPHVEEEKVEETIDNGLMIPPPDASAWKKERIRIVDDAPGQTLAAKLVHLDWTFAHGKRLDLKLLIGQALCNLWLVGPSRVGKSTFARHVLPLLFEQVAEVHKTPQGDWALPERGSRADVLVVDDLDPERHSRQFISLMMRVLRGEVNAPSRGDLGFLVVCSEKNPRAFPELIPLVDEFFVVTDIEQLPIYDPTTPITHPLTREPQTKVES